MAKISPAMEQYFAVRREYPDALLLFQMGDFFECFFDDAKHVSELLGIVLTRRGHMDGEDIPLAGFPVRALEPNCKKLFERGVPKIIVVEQMETAAQAKGVIKRDITRIVTPGTVTDEGLLDAGRENFLAAVLPPPDPEAKRAKARARGAGVEPAGGKAAKPGPPPVIGVAWVELSTGRFEVAELSPPDLLAELARIEPAEILVPESRLDPLALGDGSEGALQAASKEERVDPLILRLASLEKSDGRRVVLHTVLDREFNTKEATRNLCEHLRVDSLAGFDLEDAGPGIGAAGAVLAHLRDTQRAALDHLVSLSRYRPGQRMVLDLATKRALEITETLRSGDKAGSLLGVIDQTSTSMGKRLLRDWVTAPLRDRGLIGARHDAVERLVVDPPALDAVTQALKSMPDLERLAGKIGTRRATPRDLAALRLALGRLPALIDALETLKQPRPPRQRLIALQGGEPSGIGFQPMSPSQADGEPADRSDSDADSASGSDDGGHGLEGHATNAAPTPTALDDGGHGQDARATSALLAAVAQRMDSLDSIREPLQAILVDEPPNSHTDGGVIRPGVDPELDELRKLRYEGEAWMEEFQRRESERTGLSTLRVGYNRVFGYYIELSHAAARSAPPEYQRKQTLKNAERYITDELKRYEEKVLSADERIKAIETERFLQLREQIATGVPAILRTAAAIALIDVLASFARLAIARGYVRPAIVEEPLLEIEAGRHPVIEHAQRGDPFVPNDCHLTPDQPLTVITGPNMAGKSTYIRQVALIVLLAQVGSFVPARGATIGIADRIFTRLGGGDELVKGLSTFMVEMIETANILNHATPNSLVILDEVGRGTSTFDGLSIAWAICEHILETVRPRTLFATHYHELTQLAQQYKAVANANVAVKEWGDDVIFLRQIVPGAADKSYGIHVARLAGLPRSVVTRAHEILGNLESHRLDPKTGASGLDPSAVRIATKRKREVQLTLFVPANDPVYDALQDVNVHELTPIQALAKLEELAKLARRQP